jgi:AraC-like DNA-binding protein
VPVVGGTGRMTFDSGGETVLRWTSAWRGLLTLRTREYAVSHDAHVHDYYTIGLCEQGEADLWCRGEVHRLRPGSVFLVSPWEVHHEVVTSGRWTYTAMHPAAATMNRVLGVDSSGVLDQLEFNSPVVGQGALSDALLRLFVQLDAKPDAVVEDETTDAVRAGLRSHLRLKDGHAVTRSRRCAESARALIVNAQRPMPSQREFAELTGMSRFHFSRVFNDIVGLPPYSYFERVRLARAKALLRQGFSISRAAVAVGFSDQSHFHRHFRSRSDSTPGQYARAMRDVFVASREFSPD